MPDPAPVVTITHPGCGRIHYLAVPEGPEEPPFQEALRGEAPGDTGLEDVALDRPADLKVFMAAACPHCPHAVSAAIGLALTSDAVTVTVIDAQRFPELAERHHAQSVPLTVLDDELSIVGVVPARDLAQRILERGDDRHAVRILLALVEQNVVPELEQRVRAEGGARAFGAAWRRSATSGRITLLMIAETILEDAPRLLDEAVPQLLEALAAEDASLRGDTVDLLGRIRHPSSHKALEGMRGDPNPDVAEIVADVLEEWT